MKFPAYNKQMGMKNYVWHWEIWSILVGFTDNHNFMENLLLMYMKVLICLFKSNEKIFAF